MKKPIIVVSEETHKMFKKFCKDNMLKMNQFADVILRKFVENNENNKIENAISIDNIKIEF